LATLADYTFANVAAIWSAVYADATCIDEGATGSNIAGSPLSPAEPPSKIAELWRKLKRDLAAAEQDWDVWTDWYGARLAGKRTNQKLEIARATIPDAFWEESSDVVNYEIKRLIAQHKRHPPKKHPKPAAVPEIPPQLPFQSRTFPRPYRSA